MNRENVNFDSINEKTQYSHKDPGYGDDTPSPSRIAPPPPRPKNN